MRSLPGGTRLLATIERRGAPATIEGTCPDEVHPGRVGATQDRRRGTGRTTGGSRALQGDAAAGGSGEAGRETDSRLAATRVFEAERGCATALRFEDSRRGYR